MTKLNIAVFYGGKSTEHEVSIHSAETVGALLSPQKYQLYPVYVTSDGKWLLQIFPQDQIWDMEPLERFVNEVRTIDPYCAFSRITNSMSLAF